MRFFCHVKNWAVRVAWRGPPATSHLSAPLQFFSGSANSRPPRCSVCSERHAIIRRPEIPSCHFCSPIFTSSAIAQKTAQNGAFRSWHAEGRSPDALQILRLQPMPPTGAQTLALTHSEHHTISRLRQCQTIAKRCDPERCSFGSAGAIASFQGFSGEDHLQGSCNLAPRQRCQLFRHRRLWWTNKIDGIWVRTHMMKRYMMNGFRSH